MEKPNSVTVYVSMATTYIYWSSRLDRSDQLQLSAAIRLDGLQCMWRHYDIASKRVSHWRTREVTQLFTYLPTHKLFSSDGLESHA